MSDWTPHADELESLRSILVCGADTDEWMDEAIRWGVDEIERLRRTLGEVEQERDDIGRNYVAAKNRLEDFGVIIDDED